MSTTAKALLFVLGCYALASTIEYRVETAIAAERAATVRARAPEEPARIWSKKCARQGKDVFATRADGGPWKVTCIPRRTLSV